MDIPNTGAQKTNKLKIYDLILGTGAACSCTECLRMHKLQDFSYPFDWLCGSNFAGKIKIISSKFKDFLNKEDLIFSHTENSILCDAYRNNRNNLVFNHDFPKDIPLDISYDEVRVKYDRRINRLLDKINNSKNVLFVYIETPNTLKPLKSNDILIKAQKDLQETFPSVQCDILYIIHDENIPLGSYEYDEVSAGILRVTLFNKDLTPEVADTIINFKNLRKLFNNYLLRRE